MMILGNYWCVTYASKQPTQFLTPFFDTLQESFEQLLTVETGQSYKARVLVMPTEPMAIERVEPAVPYPCESLTSLLMRVAARGKRAVLS